MKVCFVVGEFPALSHTFVLDQVEAFARMGHDVRIVCDRIGTDPRIDLSAEPMRAIMARTHRWWRAPQGFRQGLQRLPHRLRDKVSTAADMYWNARFDDRDVVLAHFGGNGLRLARAKKRGRLAAPIVTIFHGNDVGLPYHSGTLDIYQPLFRHGALNLTVNARFRDMLVEAGAPAGRVGVHHMGIDPDAIAYRWRPWTEGPLEFISVCRLVEKKGIEFALRALAAVRAEAPGLDWRYTVVGDGPLAGDLQALARQLGLTDRVRFAGALAHVAVKQQLAQAHVFVLPSVTAADGDVEGVPVALMEAAAAGLVVVSTRHSGIPELIRHGDAGFLADERDVPGLAGALAAVGNNYAACRPMTLAARAHVETQFNSALLHRQLSDRLTGLTRHERAA